MLLRILKGARGVGVGSTISKLPSAQQMRLAVMAISASIGRGFNSESTNAAMVGTNASLQKGAVGAQQKI